jgi:hypothetical protein
MLKHLEIISDIQSNKLKTLIGFGVGETVITNLNFIWIADLYLHLSREELISNSVS